MVLQDPALKAQWLAGIGCICFVAVVWTLATVMKQVIFQDLDFNEPLILAYVCNACYIVHWPIRGGVHCVQRFRGKPWRELSEDDATIPSHSRRRLLGEAILLGVLITPVWFAAQWTYSLGVASTSVTSSTVISTTSVVWTLLASVVLLGEKLVLMAVLGIACCMGGNVATLWGSDIAGVGGQQQHVRGDLLCLAAAILYATYTIVLKRFTRLNTPLPVLFGTLGFTVLAAGTPLVFWRDNDGIRRLTPKVFGLLVFNGIFDNVLSQFAWVKAVQWTSPTAATVGLSLTIPLSVVADYARGVKLNVWSFVAAGLVIVGFVAVTLAARPGPAHEQESPRPEATAYGAGLGVSECTDAVEPRDAPENPGAPEDGLISDALKRGCLETAV